jgi:hypothetical protein
LDQEAIARLAWISTTPIRLRFGASFGTAL